MTSNSAKRRQRKSSFDIFAYIPIFIIFAVALMFVAAPVVGVGKVIAIQQALNQECKTNYNFFQVALNGDNLARLCQIKNQQITIK